MIKAKGTHVDTGAPRYYFGLSFENLNRLRDDQPIVFELAEMGVAGGGDVVIFACATDEDLCKTLGADFAALDLMRNTSIKDVDVDGVEYHAVRNDTSNIGAEQAAILRHKRGGR